LRDLNSILKEVDKSWREILKVSFSTFDEEYLDYILTSDDFFPSRENFLNAFKTLPLDKTKYILFGQDPYPRRESAIGYAFIDGKVKSIFSDKGLSKEVNRATSLRNFIKMLLLCESILSKEALTQDKIASIDKSRFCKDIVCLKNNFENNSILLLNMALIFSSKDKTKYHLKKWRGFVDRFLQEIKDKDITLILFGQASREIERFSVSKEFNKKIFPHPYNLSFITDEEVQRFFKPMNLLRD